MKSLDTHTHGLDASAQRMSRRNSEAIFVNFSDSAEFFFSVTSGRIRMPETLYCCSKKGTRYGFHFFASGCLACIALSILIPEQALKNALCH